MAPRTKADEGTSNEVKLAMAIRNHKDKISDLSKDVKDLVVRVNLLENDSQDAISALAVKFDALEKHAATLTATSINAARNAGLAPRWYRPWMGGVVLGLILVLLFALQINTRSQLAAYKDLQDQRRQDAVARMSHLDSVVNGLSERQGVAPVRSNKRRGPLPVDDVPAAVPAPSAAAVQTGTPAVDGGQ